jgi:hypothetical protein
MPPFFPIPLTQLYHANANTMGVSPSMKRVNIAALTGKNH